MRKTTTDTLSLPKFRCSLPEMVAFAGEIEETFDGEVRRQITVELEKDSFEFDDWSEIQAHLPQATEFRALTFWISDANLDDSRRFRLRIPDYMGAKPEVTAHASSAAWVAGNLALAEDFGRRNRRWYSHISGWMIWLLFMSMSLLPSAVTQGLQTEIGWPAVIAWLLALALIAFLAFRGHLWFPAGTVVLRTETNWLRRYQAEIGVLAAVVSALAAVAAAFVAAR